MPYFVLFMAKVNAECMIECGQTGNNHHILYQQFVNNR